VLKGTSRKKIQLIYALVEIKSYREKRANLFSPVSLWNLSNVEIFPMDPGKKCHRIDDSQCKNISAG